GYHGVNIGGTAITGIPYNRKKYGHLMPGVYHLPATHDLDRNAYSRGQPEHGEDFADRLEELITLHDASTIAAVVVEPVAGSGGVLIPPRNYLERLRAITAKHGILLIFDEVITGFGRLGAFSATDFFGITPDIITLAKGINSGTVPMGAVVVQDAIYDAFMQGPDHLIEFAHGYTYGAHPLACAAALAAFDVYEEEGLYTRGAPDKMGKVLEDGIHSLKGEPFVIDCRNLGMIGGVELAPRDGQPTQRALDALRHCYNESNVLVRTTGDTIAFSPPLTFTEAHVDEAIGAVRKALRAIA
nr:aminotransferase class III-fold pyridoxal phosphate-dependent enzyme [Alphaproteobacteria bacterium]